MNTKTFLIGIAGGIVVFLAGYLIYGVLMMDYFVANMTTFPGLVKEPMEIWAIGVGNIIWGILLAYILNMGKIDSGIQGAITGAILFFLFGLGMNFVAFGQYNLYTLQLSFVDAFCMALLGGLSGSVIGWLLGRNTSK
ncbi:MAG: hypothetical protein WC220_03780 [Pedobacter sp.]|jgi:hypothetical protein